MLIGEEYDKLFQQYYWGTEWKSLEHQITGDHIVLHAFTLEESLAQVDWLDGNPVIALRLKATNRHCHLWLSPSLQDSTFWARQLPHTICGIRNCDIQSLLIETCKALYGSKSLIYVLPDIHYYCSLKGLRTYSSDRPVRVTPSNVLELATWLVDVGQMYSVDPGYILNNGPAYAWYEDEQPVGFAGVHPSYMQDRIGNVGNVFVSEEHRGRGIAKSVVGAVATELLDEGRMPVYGCSVGNPASAGTAEAVGFTFAGCNYRVYVASRI